jgi:hypothetical protein
VRSCDIDGAVTMAWNNIYGQQRGMLQQCT